MLEGLPALLIIILLLLLLLSLSPLTPRREAVIERILGGLPAAMTASCMVFSGPVYTVEI